MKRIFCCFVLLPFFLNGQGTGTKTVLSDPTLLLAQSNLRYLIETNPAEEVHQLARWIVEGKVWKSFQSDTLPEECNSELVRVESRYVPTLVCNPAFLNGEVRNKAVPQTTKANRVYKYLVIYHEYVHLREHFAGRTKLMYPTEAIKDRASYANNLWNSEFVATKAEWELSKKLNVSDFMPSVKKKVAQYGEQKGFLIAFHEMLMENVAWLTNVPGVKEQLDARFKREYEKVPTRSTPR